MENFIVAQVKFNDNFLYPNQYPNIFFCFLQKPLVRTNFWGQTSSAAYDFLIEVGEQLRGHSKTTWTFFCHILTTLPTPSGQTWTFNIPPIPSSTWTLRWLWPNLPNNNMCFSTLLIPRVWKRTIVCTVLNYTTTYLINILALERMSKNHKRVTSIPYREKD